MHQFLFLCDWRSTRSSFRRSLLNLFGQKLVAQLLHFFNGLKHTTTYFQIRHYTMIVNPCICVLGFLVGCCTVCTRSETQHLSLSCLLFFCQDQNWPLLEEDLRPQMTAFYPCALFTTLTTADGDFCPWLGTAEQQQPQQLASRTRSTHTRPPPQRL